MMWWTVGGSILAVIGVVFLLIGTDRGNQANDDAHEGLAKQIRGVQDDVTTLHSEIAVKADKADVETLRAETAAGFEALSAQISDLNSDGGNADND